MIEKNNTNSANAAQANASNGASNDPAQRPVSPLATAIKTNGAAAVRPDGNTAGEAGTAKSPSIEEAVMKVRQKIQNLMQGGTKVQSAAANLVKDQAVLFIDWKKNIRSLLLASLSSAGLIAALLVLMLVWGQIKIREGKDLISKLEIISGQIDGKEKQMADVFLFQEKLMIEKQLVDSHIYWTDFFKFLESVTLPNVYFSKFSGGVDGKYKLSASAPDFAIIEKQVGILKANPYVRKASVTGGKITYIKPNPILASSTALVAPKTTISFTLELEVDPKLFYDYQPENTPEPGK